MTDDERAALVSGDAGIHYGYIAGLESALNYIATLFRSGKPLTMHTIGYAINKEIREYKQSVERTPVGCDAVERVAKALHASLPHPRGEWDDVYGPQKAEFRNMARAALVEELAGAEVESTEGDNAMIIHKEQELELPEGYEYMAPETPASRNFLDIHGPDGLVSYPDVFRLLVAHHHEEALDMAKIDHSQTTEAERPDTTVLIRLRDGTRIRSDAMPRTTAHELNSWILSYFPRDNVAVDILQETVVWRGDFGPQLGEQPHDDR